MYGYHTHSTSFRLPVPLPSPRCLWEHNDTGQFGVLTEMITCMFRVWPPVRQVHIRSHGGVMHPMQLIQRVQQQIKHLSLLTFNILRVGLPHTTPYVEFQRARKSITNWFNVKQ